MVNNFKFLLMVVLFLNFVVSVFSFQPSGGVLSLDGVDDYAILPFEEHGYLFPKKTREFTIEMWFYPKSGPNRGGSDIILSQQVYFGVASNHLRCREDVSRLCWHVQAYLDSEDGHGIVFFYVPMEINRWNYVAIIFKDKILGRAYNNRIYRLGTTAPLDRVSAEVNQRSKDFFVGGYAQAFFPFRGAPPTTGFHGDIDVIRFSRIARYDLPKIRGIEEPFEPPHHFVSDRDTLALWNFDEQKEATHFQDESKNKRMLIGMNGASIGSTLAVNPDSTSLTTTWGQIKARSR